MQLDQLWKYQQVDAEVDRYEVEMRNDADRQKLLKSRTFLVEQQQLMKKVENDVAVMADRLEALHDEAQRLMGVLTEQRAQLESNPPATVEELQKRRSAIQKTADLLTRYEQELTRMRKDSDARDHQQHEIRVRAAKVKTEFDQTKVSYDKKFQQQRVKLDKLKETANVAAKNIDPVMLKRYKEIKQHCFPPMAALNGDRCGGCNMSLPSVVMRDIRAGEKIVECDNCGRILCMIEGSADAEAKAE